MALTLRCTAGPLAGQVINVESELLLGREAPDLGRLGGDPRLSRRHARLLVDSDRALVEDLGSTNGTWVNGDRVSEARPLEVGDEVRVGQSRFTVEPSERSSTTKVREATPTTPRPGDGELVGPRLSILAGPMQGREIPLAGELLLGRSYGEPGALGGDHRLSRRHARIARGPGGVFFLEDTGSTNGTLLNGDPVRRANVLKNGDQIEIASTKLLTYGLPEASPMSDLEEPVAAAEPAAQETDGIAAFAPQGAAHARLSSRRMVAVFAAVFAAASAVAAAVILLTAPPGSRACPQGFTCHKPPTAPALHALTTFHGALGWRTEYDTQIATPITDKPAGNQLTLRESDAQDRAWGLSPGSGIIAVELRGYSARTVSARSAMQNLASSLDSQLVGTATAPSSDQMFASPVLGFHPAQGEVLEGNLNTAQGPGQLVKLAVLAASSGGVTVAVAVVYPVQQSQNQESNPDQILDSFGDQILETVRFPSDGAA